MEKDGGACVTKVFSPGAACVIPESLGGLPVTELSDRLFAGTGVEEVYLSAGLKKIGKYAFYNCERLSLFDVHGAATEIGGGLFNGCRNIREIRLHMERGARSGLRDFVTEINGRLTVCFFFMQEDGTEREEARLIFPLYYDEAVENTPARIISSSIHGTGQKYRYCFEDRKVRFDRYDRLFPLEKYEEDVFLAAEIAVCRLRYPAELSEEAKGEYEAFLREHLPELLYQAVKDEDLFSWLFGQFGESLGQSDLDRLILAASEKKKAGISGRLMEEKRRRFGAKKELFEL